MINKFFSLLFTFILVVSWQIGYSQLSGTNLAEFQFGKLPTEINDAFPSIYDRTVLNYRFNKFTAGVTLENYFTKFDDRNYASLSQYSLRYKHKKWDLKVGSLYETIGRGTLLRAFEVKGAILEDVGLRSRNYFHRDILGASAKYKTKKLAIQLMHGDILNNLIPPTNSIAERRKDRFTSLTTEYKYLKKHKAELTFFNFQMDETLANNYLNGILKGPLPLNLNYYIEYSTSITEDDQKALFAGFTGLVGALSYSIEYRNFKNFVIGSGINEPPPAIKMQTYRMLNRSTHVSNPDSEDGYQVDLFYSFENGTVVNFNHALARNDFGNFSPLFQQYFLEVSSSFSNSADYKLYIDYSKDGLKSEPNRYSIGLYNDIKLSENIRILPEFELQQIERFDETFSNQFYSLGFSYKSKLNFNFEIEITQDPFLIEEGSDQLLYPGMNVRYKLNRKHTAQMFAGQRRGGPACSAGVCYEILDFKGVEFRLSSRF